MFYYILTHLVNKLDLKDKVRLIDILRTFNKSVLNLSIEPTFTGEIIHSSRRIKSL